MKGSSLSELSFLLLVLPLWQAFNASKSERNFETSDGIDFQDENSK